MNIKHLNESFKNLYEDKVEDVKYAVDGDLRTALTDAAISLKTSGNGNIKAYEDAFQRVIEEFYPDKSWWEVTTCNIFWSLFEGRSPELTIDDIMNNLIVNETPVKESLEDDLDNDDIDDMYHDYSEDELRKMGAFDNLNESIDYIISEDDIQEFDEETGNIKIYDDVIDYQPNRIVNIQITDDSGNTVQQFKMKSVDDDGLVTLDWIGNSEDLIDNLNENIIKVNRNTKGSLEEKLNECLSRLNEASISPEDQKDSDLIRSMLAKMKNRANAKFTPEEKAYDVHYDLQWKR